MNHFRPRRNLMRRLAAVLSLAMIVLAACDESSNATQDPAGVDCPDPKMPVDGHCCFPGQTWSDDDSTCSGAPTCPDGASYTDGCPPSTLSSSDQVAWLGAACDADEQAACAALAGRYLTGDGVEKSAKKARELSQSACDAEAWNACNTLGTIAIQGAVDAPDPDTARRHFSTACDHDDGEGCKNLALMYARGVGGETDQKRAHSLYERSCKLEFEPACEVVQKMEKMEREQAAKVLEKARTGCKAGDQKACARVGRLLLYGDAGERDTKRAVDLLDTSCGAGIGSACRVLATAFYAGQRVPTDLERAEQFAQRGCSLEEDEACNILGLLYLLPPGPAVDVDKAREILGPACERGNKRACSNLGRAYLQASEDVVARPEAARDVLEKACEAGVADSCGRLAGLWEDGRGGARDPARASELNKRACDLGAQAFCTDTK